MNEQTGGAGWNGKDEFAMREVAEQPAWRPQGPALARLEVRTGQGVGRGFLVRMPKAQRPRPVCVTGAVLGLGPIGSPGEREG
jgi:hypothetical protein